MCTKPDHQKFILGPYQAVLWAYFLGITSGKTQRTIYPAGNDPRKAPCKSSVQTAIVSLQTRFFKKAHKGRQAISIQFIFPCMCTYVYMYINFLISGHILIFPLPFATSMANHTHLCCSHIWVAMLAHMLAEARTLATVIIYLHILVAVHTHNSLCARDNIF